MALLTVGLATACGPGGPPPPSPGDLSLPRPDLAGFEPVVRQRVEGLQAVAEAARDRLGGEGADSLAAAEAFGDLGRLYHSFLFLGAAETCYANAARLAPRRFEWHYLLGTVQAHQGETEQAAASFERARELATEDVTTLIRLGDQYLKLDQAAQARRAFTRASELDPASAAAFFGLGRTAALEGNAAEARDHFERALAIQPGATAIHYPLAQAYRSLGDEEKFQAHLELRGERGVDVPDPWMREVRLLEARTAIDSVRSLAARPQRLSDEELVNFAAAQFHGLGGALEEFARSVANAEPAANPRERARILLVLGSLQARDGDDAEAVANLREALRLAPDLAAARLPLAVALARTGAPAQALEVIDARLADHPDDVAARLARATVLEDLDRSAEALAELRRAVAAAPEDGTARLRLATALEKAGDLEAALGELRKGAELDLPQADRAVAYHRLGELLRRQGRTAEAKASYEQALQIDPGLLDARLGLAAALGQEGRLEEALEVYARVLAEHPEHETARAGKATVLLLLGRNREAQRELEAGLELSPGSLVLKRLLSRHLAACPDRSVRDGGRAVELATSLLRAQPTFENAETFAMALAEAGRFADAVKAQQELMNRARSAGRQADLPRLAANLERYRRGESCCAGG